MNFPPLFRSLHSSLFIAFHYLPSPFITFYHPFCFTHPSFTHHCLRHFVLLPFALLFPIVLRPLFYFLPLCFTHSIVLHRFALLSPIVYTPFALFTPIVLHPFFYSPATSANPSPAPQKAAFFSFFKEILQKPLTKQKKVIY